MPFRIDGIRHAGRGTLFTLVGALLAGGWAAGGAALAAPFETYSDIPSVLATTTQPLAFHDGGHGVGVVESQPSNPVGVSPLGQWDSPGDGVVIATDDDAYDACPSAEACPSSVPCDAPGLLQYLKMCHDRSGACWVGRADGLLLWRDAPPDRPLIVTGDGTGTPLLNADQLESTATGGVRGSILRIDGCSGNAWELGYIFAGTFTGRRVFPFVPDDPAAYALAEPGIYGENATQPFSSGTASLLARLQSAELNRHLASGPNVRWLAGFRWLQWQEQFTLADNLDDGVNLIDDFYSNDCVNNLFGGQIGVDARLLTLGRLRVESLVKAGAYYNEASQTSVYSITDYNTPENSGTSSVSVTQSPAGCSFVGEVGVTGVVPICCNWDFRVGYLALWLTGLAQPTQQLSGQQLPIGGPAVGSLTANGGTLLQGLTLGVEGRW